VGLAVVVAGLALMVASIAFTFGKLGAATTAITNRRTSVPTAARAATPAAFLDQLATAIRAGDTAALVGLLDPAVIARFGGAACEASVARLADPTAAFTVLRVGSPEPYAYTTGGRTTEVADTVPVVVAATSYGTATTTTVHLARLAGGGYAWFTDCS
jgi:hypothetical protein